jgi:hypothetical protein
MEGFCIPRSKCNLRLFELDDRITGQKGNFGVLWLAVGERWHESGYELVIPESSGADVQRETEHLRAIAFIPSEPTSALR